MAADLTSVSMSQVLYEFLPLWVFLTIVLVPVVAVFLYNQYKTQADELRRRYRTSVSEEFMAQLDSEASKSKGKKNASSNGKAKGGNSKAPAPAPAPTMSAKEAKKAAKAAAAALDDDDDDEMLMRLAQQQLNRGKKVR